MKVLLVGATGFVGSFVLRALLADPTVSSVVTLTRAPLSHSAYIHSRHLESPKLIELVRPIDGEGGPPVYPQALLDRHLRGVRACLWCVGGRHTQRSRWPTEAEYARVSIDLPVRYAEALRDGTARDAAGAESCEAPFRFVFCSGHAAEWDQEKSLRVMERTRKVKGLAEKALFELAERSGGRLEVYCARPCGIYQKNPTLKDLFWTSIILPSCHVEELAAVMIETAKSGGMEKILVHERIRKWGRELLRENMSL